MFDFLNKNQKNSSEDTDQRNYIPSLTKTIKKKICPSNSDNDNSSSRPTMINITAAEIRRLEKTIRRPSELHFFQGGVREKYKNCVKWIGRLGFIAKGVVYGCIGVLTLTNLTGAWTPNGSQGNESPQGAFLLLGGIPSIGRSVLIVMAIGLCLYIVWRFWEAITGQGSDASFGRKKNFFRYRLSPFISGLVYGAYTYYVVYMIFQTEEEQQALASSKTFPASWTATAIGRTGIVFLGIAFLIAFFTQIINAIQGTFIKDLKTSEPGARKWVAFLIHTLGRIGFFGRAALFGTLSGFFWDSLAKGNQSGDKNMVAAAVSKLANSKGGRFFMVILGISLVIYALFAVLNVHYKYFPTPPPTRQEFYTNQFVYPQMGQSDIESQLQEKEKRVSFIERYLPFLRTDNNTKENGKTGNFFSKLFSKYTH